MSLDLQEYKIPGQWQAQAAGLGGNITIGRFNNRADAVEEAIKYKEANSSAWVAVVNTDQTIVVVNDV